MLSRTEIRELILEKLMEQTDAGNRVYDSRIINPEEEELPLIAIFTPSELPEGGSLFITVEIAALVNTNFGENVGVKIDTLCQQITTVLRRFWEDSGELSASYRGTQISLNPEGAQPFAAAKINYEIELLDDE